MLQYVNSVKMGVKMATIDEILERVSEVERKVSRVKSKIAYRDLTQMIQNVDRQVTELSKEDVLCRQTKRITIRYKEIDKNIDEMLSTIEKMVTFAHLINTD